MQKIVCLVLHSGEEFYSFDVNDKTITFAVISTQDENLMSSFWIGNILSIDKQTHSCNGSLLTVKQIYVGKKIMSTSLVFINK